MPETRTARTTPTGIKKQKRISNDALVGACVKTVRPMTENEIVSQGWNIPETGVWPTCIEFTSGEILTASQDPADRVDYRAGTLVGVDETGDRFQLRTLIVPEPSACGEYGPKHPYPLPAAKLSDRGRRVMRHGISSDNNED